MNQIELEPETRKVLDRIRHSSKVLSIYEMPADLAETAVWEIGKVLVDNQHPKNVQYQTYRWFLREVAKLLRTKTGWDLALELEICLRKWQDYRLDPVLCQALVRECCERIAAMTPEEVEEKVEVKVEDKHGVAHQGEIPPLGENASVGMTGTTKEGEVSPRKHEGHETRSPNDE
jgi:hypothetical protein